MTIGTLNADYHEFVESKMSGSIAGSIDEQPHK